MIRRKHKVLSVVLCLALMLGVLFMLPVGTSAASGDKIYVRVPSGWTQAYCYMWTEGSGNNGTWPGVKMTATSESGVFTYTVTGGFNKIIFNNGNSGVGTNQTSDLSYGNYNGQICDITNINDPKWSAYGGGDVTDPTDPPIPGGEITVYFRNTDKWSNPNCYMWNGDGGAGNQNNVWPGDPMTEVGEDVWKYTTHTAYENCIFNGSEQTANLQTMDGYLYDWSKKAWEPFDPGALKVKSYAANPATNVYKGAEVSLSASATSSEGTVKYKFSVGSTVIKDFSTSGKATWTPSAAGSFTLTFDFMDTAGNTAQRTISITVQDDTNVSNPIIKKVTPADDGYVQTGAQATISVTAGGGKTGTNLLFYKYVVVDPTGAQNVAYYTMNSTYNFTPAKNGAYQITVTVQASDNSEATKTFNVESVGEIPTDPTEPTDPTQPTQPTDPTDPTEPDYQLGDVNKDGDVNIKDGTYLQKYLALYEGYTVTVALGDVNRDGRVSIKDVTEIQRICAEYYV